MDRAESQHPELEQEVEKSLSLTQEDLTKRRLVLLSFPVMISLIAQNLIGVIDTAFLARLGDAELGGTAMASLVYYSIYTIGFGLASGTQIMVSHRYGSGRKDEIGRILGQSLHMLLLAALGMIVLGVPLGKWIFDTLLTSDNVAAAATEYWDYLIFGYIFAFTAAVFRSFFVGISNTRVLTYNALVMSVVNIVLDYGLIFGNLGMPALGVKGAAIASVLSQVASVVFYLIYVIARVDCKLFKINRSNLLAWDPWMMKALLHLSYYLMLQALISQSGWTIFFFMMEGLGERQLAVASIVRSLYSLLLIPGVSFNTAVRTTVSQIVGAGIDEHVQPYLRRAMSVSFSVVLAMTTLVFIFPKVLLHIYSSDPTLVAMAIPALRMIGVALVIHSVGGLHFAAVGATGATKMVFLIDLVNTIFYVILGAVVVYLLKGSVAACFSVEVIYYLSVTVMSYTFIKHSKWREPRWSRIQ
ncbi:MAG: MATE family efflux transporter [Porphyromonas sp.]|nr:MATE family efflux transporter [Porphyromonas sp.]